MKNIEPIFDDEDRKRELIGFLKSDKEIGILIKKRFVKLFLTVYLTVALTSGVMGWILASAYHGSYVSRLFFKNELIKRDAERERMRVNVSKLKVANNRLKFKKYVLVENLVRNGVIH